MLDGELQLHLRTLGHTLRKLRMEKGYSLAEVALGTGLSTSFLSLLENGRSDVSTGRLFRVARFLDVGLGDLLDMETPRGVIVVRAGERQVVDMPGEGLRMFPLVNDRDDVVMAPIVSELDVGARLDDLPTTEGVEHFVFVLRGMVGMVIDQRAEALMLAPGDCAYFGATHAAKEITNAGDETAEMLWISSPPPLRRADLR